MSNALFLSGYWFEDATVSASSVQGLLTANHVQTIRPDQVWRATGCAAESLVWQHTVAVETNAAAVVAHNLTTDATLRLRLATSQANLTAAPDVDSTVVPAWPYTGKPTDPDWPSYFSLVMADNFTGYKWGRLDIVDPTNPDGFIQIGRLFVGPAFVPTLNVDNNPSLGLASPDEVIRTPFGRAYGDTRGPASRLMQVPMSAIDEDEMGEELFELQRYAGLAKDFAFCLDPAATARFHRYAMQARFSNLSPFQAAPVWNEINQLWQTALALEEIL